MLTQKFRAEYTAKVIKNREIINKEEEKYKDDDDSCLNQPLIHGTMSEREYHQNLFHYEFKNYCREEDRFTDHS